MRLDKFIVESGLASRTEIAKVARGGGITVNGQVVRRASGDPSPPSTLLLMLRMTPSVSLGSSQGRGPACLVATTSPCLHHNVDE